MRQITDKQLENGVYFKAPKKYKTRPPTQNGNTLIPVWFCNQIYHKYLLITSDTEIYLAGNGYRRISSSDLPGLKLIEDAKKYFVKGKNNSSNIKTDYLEIFC